MHGLWALTIRSLRSDARLLRFHLARLGVSTLILFVLFSSLSSSYSGTAPGRTVLLGMLSLNMMIVTWGGALLFAPVISEEKEAGTLGLLRMTGMGPASLVLGSLVPRLTQVGLILVIQVPLMCLTVTLGGVDWSHVRTAFVLVASQLVFIASLGALNSVIFETAGRAVAATLVSSILWMNVPPLVWPSAWVNLSLWTYSRTMRMTGGRLEGVEYAGLFHLALSAGLVLLAIVLLDWLNLHQSSSEPIVPLHERVWRWLSRPTARVPSKPTAHSEEHESPQESEGSSFQRRASIPVWQESLAWKDYFLLGGGQTGYHVRWALAVLVPLTIAATHNGPPSWLGQSIFRTSLWILSVDAIYLTVNLFGSEVRNQTWETIQTLPLSLKEICRQKILGAAQHLLPWATSAIVGALIAESFADWLMFFFTRPVQFVSIVSHGFVQITAILMTLTLLSLRLNPWVAVFLAGLAHGLGLFLLTIISLMTFGIFGPPSPALAIFLYNGLWIAVGVIYITMCSRAISDRLDPTSS